MAKKMRLTQEEEIIKLLSREGFREITSEEFLQEPYKNFKKMPDCFEHNVPLKSAIRKTI